MNEQQRFRDPIIEPTSALIAVALGDANPAYEQFIEQLQTRNISVDWRYYKDGNAWLGKGLHKWTTTRGTQKETTAFWLAIWEGFFKVTFYIPERCRADALNLPLEGDVKQMVAEAKQMGKLKFFPVTFELHSPKLLDAVMLLVDFRKAIK